MHTLLITYTGNKIVIIMNDYYLYFVNNFTPLTTAKNKVHKKPQCESNLLLISSNHGSCWYMRTNNKIDYDDTQCKNRAVTLYCIWLRNNNSIHNYMPIEYWLQDLTWNIQSISNILELWSFTRITRIP